MPALYHIHHETGYRYAGGIPLSRQLLHLSPRVMPEQWIVRHELSFSPEPVHIDRRSDAFGNPVAQLEFRTPHHELLVAAESEIRVDGRPLPPPPESTPDWQDVREHLRYRAGIHWGGGEMEALRYLFESPYVPVKGEFVQHAGRFFPPGKPWLAALLDLMHHIHRDFTFDPSATTVATPALEVLRHRRGVCQDFAHLMLACLRSLGLPARYVSGYLRTDPPPGMPRLIGADASHAWISAWCPCIGWIDFDPTNDCIPGLDHITFAWGRDFSDVSPMRGVILGAGDHDITIRVTVTPLDGPRQLESAQWQSGESRGPWHPPPNPVG